MRPWIIVVGALAVLAFVHFGGAYYGALELKALKEKFR